MAYLQCSITASASARSYNMGIVPRLEAYASETDREDFMVDRHVGEYLQFTLDKEVFCNLITMTDGGAADKDVLFQFNGGDPWTPPESAAVFSNASVSLDEKVLTLPLSDFFTLHNQPNQENPAEVATHPGLAVTITGSATGTNTMNYVWGHPESAQIDISKKDNELAVDNINIGEGFKSERAGNDVLGVSTYLPEYQGYYRYMPISGSISEIEITNSAMSSAVHAVCDAAGVPSTLAEVISQMKVASNGFDGLVSAQRNAEIVATIEIRQHHNNMSKSNLGVNIVFDNST